MIDIKEELDELMILGYSREKAFDMIKGTIKERKENIRTNRKYENDELMTFTQKAQMYNR